MTTQKELGQMFAQGESNGSASNVQLIETQSGSAIVGYGHAIYYELVDGKIIEYDWYGYSSSTSGQISKIKSGILSAGRRSDIEQSDERKEARLE